VAIKRLICPERVRKVPAQFSWVDHRLVRERHIERCDAHAAALYLFLVTVADAQGLSYYSVRARTDLIRLRLVAYEQPLYQVLALDAPAPEDVRTRLDQLRQLLGKVP
jgi:hypothetical protein